MGHIDPKLNEMLLPLLGSQELVEKWWNRSNKAFALETPASIYESNPDFIVKYVMQYTQCKGS